MSGRVGAHTSAAGGLAKAVERGLAVGADALQVFTKNSNQWGAKPIGADEAASFRSATAGAGLNGALAAHAAYLINLASQDEAVRGRSVTALADEIRRCDVAGIPYLVLHPGSHGGDGAEVGLDRIARGLDQAAALTPNASVTVLLETAAGQGSCLGHTFTELREMLRRSDSRDRLAICFDTCHVHAAGYDLVSKDGWRATLDELDGAFGTSRVKLVHANDSKKERGCRVDRHERIGRGCLGDAAFENLMTEPLLVHAPKILETPKDEAGEYDREGIARLRKLGGITT